VAWLLGGMAREAHVTYTEHKYILFIFYASLSVHILDNLIILGVVSSVFGFDVCTECCNSLVWKALW
jgi:hypothetical protein